MNKLAKPKTNNTEKIKKTKWATFSYVGKETKFITKLFKGSQINIAFTTRNTIKKLLTDNRHQKKEKFEHSGVYQLACPDCDMRYVGQMGRPF
jgi:hypothetical protein